MTVSEDKLSIELQRGLNAAGRFLSKSGLVIKTNPNL